MSATATPETSAAPQPSEREPSSLYKFSVWVHVGAGADECTEVDERTGENTCGDSGHFHAWCRLPNQFQHREIQANAAAAKARKIRQLRDPESNAYLILDDEIERLRDAGEDSREEVIAELLQTTWAEDYLRAVREVGDIEDTDADVEDDEELPKLYGSIDEDRDRLIHLLSKPEEERQAEQEEIDAINKHMVAYNEAISQQLDRLQAPRRESLENLDIDDLCEQLRKKRIKTVGDNEFSHQFSVGEWLSCTYRTPKGAPVFADLDELEEAPNDVIAALESVFTDLERTAQTAGN